MINRKEVHNDRNYNGAALANARLVNCFLGATGKTLDGKLGEVDNKLEEVDEKLSGVIVKWLGVYEEDPEVTKKNVGAIYRNSDNSKTYILADYIDN